MKCIVKPIPPTDCTNSLLKYTAKLNPSRICPRTRSGAVAERSAAVCPQREDVGETPFPYHKIKDLLKDGDEVSVQLKVRGVGTIST